MNDVTRSATFERASLNLLAIAACATQLLSGTTAVAQESPNTAPNAESGALEEVVVTARYRSEDLQSVPEAITAFSAPEIRDARIQKFGDFAALTPNVEFFPSSSPGVFQMSIRGISQANEGLPPIVMVVDGVTLPYENSFTMPLFDIQSIEVLKGPQGALYGQNAIGGAVVVNTVQPTNNFDGRVTASYGGFGENEVTGIISGPIIKDTVLFRLAGFHHEFDGDVNYAYTPRDLENYLHDNMARLDLKFLASDFFTADLAASYGTTLSGAEPLVPVTYSPKSGIPGVSTAYLNSQLVLGIPNQDYHTHTSRSSADGSLRMVWKLGFADLISITAGTNLHENNLQDLDVSDIPFVQLEGQPQLVHAWSQELRLTSPSDQRLRWTAGVFTQRVHYEQTNEVYANLSLLTTGNLNPADAMYIPLSINEQDEQLNSYAGFAQLNYDVLSDLELTVAGRYDHDPRSQVSGTPGALGNYEQRTFENFQPKASLAYKPTSAQTYYTTFSKGFRPGGFNATSTLVQPVYDPELTTNYEVGAKFEFFDRRMSLSLAGYYTDYKNQQLTLVQVTATSATQNIFTVKKDTIKGIEIEAQARPITGLDIGFGFGAQDAKIKEFGNALTGSGFDPSAYVGNYVPLQSKYTLNASAQYTHAVTSSLDGFVRMDLSRKGTLYWDPDNRVTRPPFNVVNAKIGMRHDPWEINLFGSNIFNARYYTLYFDNKFVGAPGGFDFADVADDRRYGIEATYRF
jgi:iron complex outermembrane receptor protein